MPHSRPWPIIGPRCHELRGVDWDVIWRIVYRVRPDAISLEVFAKKSNENSVSGDRNLQAASGQV